MSKQVPVAYQYHNEDLVRDLIGIRQTKNNISNLTAGIRKGSSVQPSLKMLKDEVVDNLFMFGGVFMILFILIFPLIATFGFGAGNQWYWWAVDFVSTLSVSAFSTVYIPLKRDLRIEQAPLSGKVLDTYKRAEYAVQDLKESEAWNNKKDYPQVTRFDLKETLEKIHEMAVIAEYELRNNPDRWITEDHGNSFYSYFTEVENTKVLDESEAYQTLSKTVHGLVTLVKHMRQIEEEWAKIEQVRKKAIEVSVNDAAALKVLDAVENNQLVVDATKETVERIQNDGWDAEAVAILKQKHPKQVSK